METKKLYYENCHLQAFSATVISCTKTPKGYAILLDSTAFYPEGGGQACDLGTLNDANVLDVQEQGEQVVHLCDKALSGTVTGTIDWTRRFDLMQQHTGEHILSGLIHKKFGYHNVGFHIGSDVMEVDFDGPISWEELMELEEKANQAVWENLSVQVSYPAPETLAAIPYRSKKALNWPVRIVEIPGYDICACCGVHTAYTGEVGIVKVLSCVKFHQGVRIQMVCGNRAYQYLRQVQEQNRQVSQLFSAKPLETSMAASQFQQQLTEEKFRATGLQKRLFEAIAAGYAGNGKAVHFEPNLPPAAVRELADKIAAVCGGTATVFSGTDEWGYSVCILGPDAKELGTALIQAFPGRGGGKPGTFQGSIQATKAQLLDYFS